MTDDEITIIAAIIGVVGLIVSALISKNRKKTKEENSKDLKGNEDA